MDYERLSQLQNRLQSETKKAEGRLKPTPSACFYNLVRMVGAIGFEPTTPCSRSRMGLFWRNAGSGSWGYVYEGERLMFALKSALSEQISLSAAAARDSASSFPA